MEYINSICSRKRALEQLDIALEEYKQNVEAFKNEEANKKHYLILDKAGYKEGENWIENMTWFSNYPVCNSIESAYKKVIDTISGPFFSGGFDELLRVPEDKLPKLEKIEKFFSEYGDIGAPYEWAYEYEDPEYDDSTGMVGFQIWRVEVEE